MVDKPTVVKYDVKQAINELKKLNKEVDKSGEVAKDSFGDADAAADQLTSGLGRLSPAASGASSALASVGVSGGLAGAALAVAAAGGAQLVNAFFNVPELLKDTNEQLNQLKEGGRAAQDFADSASAIGDALALRQFTVQRRELAATAAQLTDEQNRIDIAKRGAQETLTVELAKFRSLESAARESAKERESIEERLNRKRNELEADAIGRGRTAGGAIADLTGEAQRAARAGDVDRAELLVERAKELSKELGNHAFFTNQIDSANQAIIRSLESQAREARNQERTDQTAAEEARAQIEIIERRKKALDEEFALISRNLRAVGAQRRRVSLGRQEEIDFQTADQAARDIGTARDELERLANAGFSLGDVLADFTRGVPDTFTRSSERARELVDEFNNIEGAAIITQGVFEGTPVSLQRANEQAIELRKTLTAITADPSFPAELQDNADRLENLLDTLRRATRAGVGAAAAGIGPTEEITSGRDRIRTENQLKQLDAAIAQDQEKIANNAERSAAAFERSARATQQIRDNTGGTLPNVPAVAPAPTTDAGGGATPIGAPVTQTFNINANVKGGIIDREVTEQIIDIFDREFRRRTGGGR